MPGIALQGDHIVYYSSPAGYLNKDIAVVDTMFRGDEMTTWLAKRQLRAEWRDGVYERLMAGGAAESLRRGETPEPLKSCRVWRLRPDAEFGMRHRDYRSFFREFGQPNPDDYTAIFDGQVPTNDLAALDERFTNDPPRGFEYPLSKGDVLELYDAGGSETYYADQMGFVKFEFGCPAQGLELQCP